MKKILISNEVGTPKSSQDVTPKKEGTIKTRKKIILKPHNGIKVAIR